MVSVSGESEDRKLGILKIFHGYPPVWVFQFFSMRFSSMSISEGLFCRSKPGPLGQSLISPPEVRDNRLCRESCYKRERNDGILECWPALARRMGKLLLLMQYLRFIH